MPSDRAPLTAPGSTLLNLASVAAPSPAASVAVRAVSVLFITGLTAAAAQISVPLPFSPVPFVLTPAVVLIGGAVLGSRLGALSQVLYLLLGVAGWQVFAPSPVLPPGFARLLGPTGGFLLAYPLAAFVTGWLAERGFDRRYLTSVLAMFAGLAVIFAGGVSWLAALLPPQPGHAGPIGLGPALAIGFYPFVAVDVVKIALASMLLPSLWKLLGRASR